jgi:cellulose synthase/poly-beta-1,6-N-acetylglucosamine synthase-like glycosyltransferase
MIAFSYILFLSLTILTLATAYLALLAFVCLFRRPDEAGSGPAPRVRFAFVVPAHDEEAGILETIRSLQGVTYPRSLFDVVVVADNCTDETAAIAGNAGALCLERRDAARRGKGYALAFAFSALQDRGYDAFVVIDADSVVSENLLEALGRRLDAGERVIQVYDGLSNPDASALTYLFLVGNVIENTLFYEAKARLGLSANLRGNGMCFSREILDRYPWNAYSVAEDTEYGLNLLMDGVMIHFAPEAKVLARQPETLEQAQMQRIRWASGNARVSRMAAFRLMRRGVTLNSLMIFDAGLSLFVLSKPLMLLGSLVLTAAALVYRFMTPDAGMGYPLWAGTLLLLQAAYLAAGVFMARFSLTRLRYLVSSPVLLVWFFFVTLLGMAGFRSNLWVRTKRL